MESTDARKRTHTHTHANTQSICTYIYMLTQKINLTVVPECVSTTKHQITGCMHSTAPTENLKFNNRSNGLLSVR